MGSRGARPALVRRRPVRQRIENTWFPWLRNQPSEQRACRDAKFLPCRFRRFHGHGFRSRGRFSEKICGKLDFVIFVRVQKCTQLWLPKLKMSQNNAYFVAGRLMRESNFATQFSPRPRAARRIASMRSISSNFLKVALAALLTGFACSAYAIPAGPFPVGQLIPAGPFPVGQLIPAGPFPVGQIIPAGPFPVGQLIPLGPS